MAKSATAVGFNTLEWDAVLDRLAGPGRESLARRMGVSGGRVLRDEARARASVSYADTQFKYNPESRGSKGEGTLAEAIYVAFNDRLSDGIKFTYSISWNHFDAFWGRFREFGHWIEYRFFYDETGVYHTIKSQPLRVKVWVPAHPFLAPAFDASIAQCRAAMIARGRVELPKILRGE